MAKLRTDPDVAAREGFRTEIRVCRARLDMSQRGLADCMGEVPSVVSKLLAEPDRLSVERLRKIVRTLGPDPMVVLKLLGYSQRDLKAFANKNENGGNYGSE